MHRPARIVAAASLVAASLVTLSGCVLLPQKTFDETIAIDEKITAVEFDGDSGSVTILGVDDLDEVTVYRELRYRFDLPDEDSHRVREGVLVLEDCGPQCSVSYTVEVPSRIPVSGATSNGAIDVSNLGDIDVKTSNGRITLDDIVGEVHAKTSNGRIEGRALTDGTVEAESSNGSIELETDGTADVTAHTSNGSITLTAPRGDYRIDIETSNGGTSNELGSDPDADIRFDLRTSNGSITVLRG
ncbi:MAG: DUF4097 family beta strand repeat protein [Salinibacterium sp.]|nr:DUF4097 family beta strand repeat-containing protein [Salinibacterium sp.]MBF0672948.1 DUF4097 family beta strand repeat protein [Salinibacterium sp.]